jgi:hypothetical protein
LVAVAAGLQQEEAGGNGGGGNVVEGSQIGNEDPIEPAILATSRPTAAPSISPKPGMAEAPSPSPTTNFESSMPSVAVTETTTEDPGPSTNIVTFYATAGRFQGTDLEELEANLPFLPTDGGNAFMVNLGDWNSPFATGCSEASYTENADMFNQSSVPVLFIPGDNEYNDCPDPEGALTLWEDTLLDFELRNENWQLPFTVTRQEPDYPENFAFLYENILFLGINLVGGTIHDDAEWAARQAADLEWIDSNVEANRGQMYWMVLFAHADPDIQSSDPFYSPFFEKVRDSYGVPVLLIHRNLGIESSGYEPNYQGIDGLVVLVVEGSIWPPMKIELNAAGAFTFDQATWYEDEVGG